MFVHPIRKTVDVWDAATDTTIENSSYENKNFRLKTYILDKEDNIVGKDEKVFSIAGGSKTEINQSILTYSPLLWDIDAPNLYTMVSELYENDSLVDSQKNTFGFRTIAINKDKGFFLNGRHVPLYGTCNHQDHAGVGVAVPDSVNEYRIKLLKEMGSNAYRCAHGNPNPEILDYCDKYGILVMDENRNFNSSADGIKQVQDMVMRDRNHPSVVMYSLFNEEPLQGTPTGRKLAERLQCEIKKLDSTRFLLGAMNTGVTTDGGALTISPILMTTSEKSTPICRCWAVKTTVLFKLAVFTRPTTARILSTVTTVKPLLGAIHIVTVLSKSIFVRTLWDFSYGQALTIAVSRLRLNGRQSVLNSASWILAVSKKTLFILTKHSLQMSR